MIVRKRPKGRRVRLNPPRTTVAIVEPTGSVATPKVNHPKPVARPRRRAFPIVRLLRRLDTALVYAVLALLGVSLWFSPRTQLQRLEIVGVPDSVQTPIRERLTPLLDQHPALTHLPQRMENALQQMGWVQQAVWIAQTPHRARVLVTARTPFIEVRYPNGEKRYLDPTGFLYRAPKNVSAVPGGVIELSHPASPPLDGERIDPAMQHAFALLGTLAQERTAQQARVTIQPTGELLLHCQPWGRSLPLTFRLGDALSWQAQLRLIRAVLTHANPEMAHWEYIDLKSPFAPAIKHRSGGDPNE
ncbi:MAG: hypothetical protein C4336_00810 [Armatimonadota bacterium]